MHRCQHTCAMGSRARSLSRTASSIERAARKQAAARTFRFDFYQYGQVVAAALSNARIGGSEKCVATIAAAVQQLADLVKVAASARASRGTLCFPDTIACLPHSGVLYGLGRSINQPSTAPLCCAALCARSVLCARVALERLGVPWAISKDIPWLYGIRRIGPSLAVTRKVSRMTWYPTRHGIPGIRRRSALPNASSLLSWALPQIAGGQRRERLFAAERPALPSDRHGPRPVPVPAADIQVLLSAVLGRSTHGYSAYYGALWRAPRRAPASLSAARRAAMSRSRRSTML